MTRGSKRDHSLGITLRIALLSWLVTAATILIFLLVILPQQKKTYLEDLDSKARGVAVSLRNVAVGAIVNGDYGSVVDHCNEMLKGDHAIAYIVLTRKDGFSLVHEPSGWRTETLAGRWLPASRAPASGIGVVPRFNRRVFHDSEPLDYSGIEWGWIHVGLSLEHYDRNVARAYQRTGLLAVSCIALGLVASLFYARRLVNPILSLQSLVRQIAEGDFSARVPITRHDELGRLAQSINTMAGALEHRDNILESVRFAAQQFLSQPNWQNSIQEVLAKIGGSAGLSRAYVLENSIASATNGEGAARHLWTAPGASLSPSHPALQALSGIGTHFERWVQRLKRGEIVAVQAAEMEPTQQALLDQHGIKSLILIPIKDQQSWWGCLGFDDCVQERRWTEAERDTFRAAADMVGAAHARQRAQDALVKANEQLQKEIGERRLVQEALRVSEQQLRQAQKMEAVGQLAAGVAHDFNNIMTIILGHASLSLASPNLSRPMADSLKEISAAADRAAGLTRQLLAFSRKQIIQRRPLDVNEVLKNLNRMLRRLVGEDIALRWNLPEPLPRALADVGCLEQVMVNLVVNARDAMPHGGQLLIETSSQVLDAEAAGAHPDVRPGQYVCVRVEDTGYGMTPEVMEHVFEPFFTTKDVGKGSGLGLATVYGLLKQHDGWIEVSSAVGHGSTFRFYLPVTVEQPEPARAAKSDTLLPGGGESILLVEDEAGVRDLTGHLLQHHGYTVHTAGSGAEALQVWEDQGGRFDLLVTDVVMPGGMSGHVLAQMLRAGAPHLPVVYMSGYSFKLTAEELEKENGARFLQKPFNLSQLLGTVRHCLERPPLPNGPAAPQCEVAE